MSVEERVGKLEAAVAGEANKEAPDCLLPALSQGLEDVVRDLVMRLQENTTHDAELAKQIEELVKHLTGSYKYNSAIFPRMRGRKVLIGDRKPTELEMQFFTAGVMQGLLAADIDDGDVIQEALSKLNIPMMKCDKCDEWRPANRMKLDPTGKTEMVVGLDCEKCAF